MMNEGLCKVIEVFFVVVGEFWVVEGFDVLGGDWELFYVDVFEDFEEFVVVLGIGEGVWDIIFIGVFGVVGG